MSVCLVSAQSPYHGASEAWFCIITSWVAVISIGLSVSLYSRPRFSRIPPGPPAPCKRSSIFHTALRAANEKEWGLSEHPQSSRTCGSVAHGRMGWMPHLKLDFLMRRIAHTCSNGPFAFNAGEPSAWVLPDVNSRRGHGV